MAFVKKLMLLALGAVAAMALAATPAMAQQAQIEEHGEEYAGGEVTIELASNNAVFDTPLGDITCNESTGHGSVDEAHIDGPTEVGEMESLSFSQNGSHLCPTDIFGISNCETEVENLPYDVVVTPLGSGQYAIGLTNVLVTLHCNSIVGEIDCQYETPSADVVVGDGQEVGTTDEHLTLVSGSFLCPEEGVFEAQYEIDDAASGEHLTIEGV